MAPIARSSGILLHPTSLSGPHGIGDLGPAAHRWIEWLASTGCGWWQILPLGPTGYGDSPYQCFSAFAGNPYLISPESLQADGLLTSEDLADAPSFGDGRADFGHVVPWKRDLLDRAFARFERDPSPFASDVAAFREAERGWVHDFVEFMAIKESHGGGSWQDWPDALRRRDDNALATARRDLAPEIERHLFHQFIFDRKWMLLWAAASERGIAVIGDAPMFVSGDSADVWSRPALFALDDELKPRLVAGVPPDRFSDTGQLWGNPQYDWDAHAADGYAWWVGRLRRLLRQGDLVRIDHFRALADYWEIPAGSATAAVGRWVGGPGDAFLTAVEDALGALPIIAEDLGEPHIAVGALRDRFALPGMAILQFAYDDDATALPEGSLDNKIVYTGTHDNDTAVGWYRGLSRSSRRVVAGAIGSEGHNVAWRMIETAWASTGCLAIAPLQDVLGLGNDARMNVPSVAAGNWSWRMHAGALTEQRAESLADLNRRTGRTSGRR